MKKVLRIAGSDCSGSAGIQADLKTFSAHGVYGMSVIVSVVAENTCRVLGIQDVSPDMIGRQMDAVLCFVEVWKRLFCSAFQEGGRNTEQQLRGSALTEFLVRKTGYRQEAVRTGRMTRQDLECTNYS